MTVRRAAWRTLVATGAAAPLILLPGLAAAATGDAEATVRKSVQVLMSPDGTINASRLYTQVSATGEGTVTFTDAVSGSLRDLDGFSAPTVTDGTAQYDLQVAGAQSLRNLQDFPAGALPISITVSATLDGEPIAPADVVGRSGLLRMTYQVENRTAAEQEVSWTGGDGQQVTRTATVPLPYVGTMQTILPAGYRDISAPGASLGGDGRGATKLSYTLILFEPLGSTTATLSYESRVTNASLPQVDFTFLPTAPKDNPTTASAQEQYQGGQQTGAQLTAGATEIDANLIKLADGAGTLLAGLKKLYAGAGELHNGLADTAAPGARKLAAGADELSAGLNETAAPGANQIAAGASELAAGINGKLAPGGKKLAAGAGDLAKGAKDAAAGGKRLDAGAATLASGLGGLQAGLAQLKGGIDQLPTGIKDNPGFQALKDALAGVQQGIGSPGDASPSTVLGGLNAIRRGLDNPNTGSPANGNPCNSSAPATASDACGVKDALQLLKFGLSNPACNPADPTNPMNPCGVKEGIDRVRTGLAGASASGGDLDNLIAAATGAYAATGCPTAAGGVPVPGVYPPSVLTGPPFSLPPNDKCVLNAGVVYGLALPAGVVSTTDPGGVKAQTSAAAAGLAQVSAGLSGSARPGRHKVLDGGRPDAHAGPPPTPTARPSAPLSNPACDPADPKNATNPCGISQIQALVSGGIDQLVAAIAQQLAAAVGSATAGCDPTKSLSCGAAALGAGANQLSSGSQELATGLGTLSGGAGRLHAGASTLSDGIGTAGAGAGKLAAGADKLATGLGTAADGSAQIATGAGDLAAGLGTAADGSAQIADGLGQAVAGAAQLQEGGERISAEGMQQIVAAGKDTTDSFGEKYAVMEALNTRAATGEGIPNGAASGARVATTGAFSYVVAPATPESDTTALRFVLAGVLLGAAVGVGTVLHRRAT